VDGVGDGLDNEPTGGSGGLGLTPTGSDGVGIGRGTGVGKAGVGTTGVGRTGVGTTGVGIAGTLGVIIGGVGSGLGKGKSAAETGKSNAASAGKVAQPTRARCNNHRPRALPLDGRDIWLCPPLVDGVLVFLIRAPN
jgi:hypothetical protein